MIDQLILRAQEGDLKAFEELYGEYKDFVWKVICRMIDNEEDRKDLFQDVFVKVYQKLGLYRFEARFSTWLYKVTFSTVLNHLSKQKRSRLAAQVFKRDLQTEVRQEEELVDVDSEKLVEQILKDLNPVQRACVILKDVESFSYEEIAQMLSLNIGTVRSNLNRGRNVLRKKWNKEGCDEHVMSIR
ncbi:RNA polymerase sigma factor [Candidatus Margulisiibacteriota bacterium]